MTIDFKGSWFAKEVILQCNRWYLAYKLSYQDFEEMMAERGPRGTTPQSKDG